jgi:putative nucleotidyltransferase with HDIG domain
MTTARSDRDSVVAAIQAGVNDYVRKPFEKKALIDKTRKLLAPTLATLETGITVAPAAVLSPLEEVAKRIKSGHTGSLTLPDLTLKLQEVIRSGEKSPDVLADVLTTNLNVAMRLIELANTDYYRSDKKCTTLKSAVLGIGFQETCDCALGLSMQELFQSDSVLFADILQRIWEHSMAVGFCANLLANRLRIKSLEHYYTMGMLHDLGKLLLINILKELPKGGKALDKASIYQVLDTYHPQVGADLLAKWKYPKPFIDLIKHHHDADYLHQCSPGMRLVCVADMLTSKIGLSLHAQTESEVSDKELRSLLDLDQQAFDSVLMEVKLYIAAIKSVL